MSPYCFLWEENRFSSNLIFTIKESDYYDCGFIIIYGSMRICQILEAICWKNAIFLIILHFMNAAKIFFSLWILNYTCYNEITHFNVNLILNCGCLPLVTRFIFHFLRPPTEEKTFELIHYFLRMPSIILSEHNNSKLFEK